MADVRSLRCTVTSEEFAPGALEYTNPAVGEVATLDVLYDYDKLRATLDRDALKADFTPTMWRYRVLTPIAPDSEVPPLPVGWTPLVESTRLAEDLGVRVAWVKDDGLNPTASLKDRASAMVVARAMERGISTVSTASTGNAAAALAGVGASIQSRKMDIVIFVPASAPEAKIAQLLVYGAKVVLVKDSYDVAFDLCTQVCQEAGWYCRSTGINPYTTEGKKTVAFEIAEQLNWDVPDVVVVSVGDGSIISGTYKGFWELYQLGWIERIPRLIGVQSEGSRALVHAWENGLSATEMTPQPAETLADSISAGLPRDRAKALRAVRETDGAYLSVPDDEIIASIPKLAQLTGVFAEPAAAAVYAGAQRAVQSGLVRSDERTLLLVTGNGLKDVRRAQQSVAGGLVVEPTIEAVRDALQLAEIS